MDTENVPNRREVGEIWGKKGGGNCGMAQVTEIEVPSNNDATRGDVCRLVGKV